MWIVTPMATASKMSVTQNLPPTNQMLTLIDAQSVKSVVHFCRAVMPRPDLYVVMYLPS